MTDGPFSSMDVSASALVAERLRMNVIAGNIANANVLRTPDGGPYKRRQVSFESVLAGATADGETPGMVRAKIEIDNSPGELRHEPGNPYANENGDVVLPNVTPATEMVDLMTAARSYEANLSAIKIYREMVLKSIQIGK
ncbi:MAG: flagellar basal body rod protein FlgC [Planctomycetes bacterium]|nr:flagellar basal body rod protein FlgC [Planctomycetota bacterium]